MLLFVTYPLIFAVSVWAFNVAILPGDKPFIVALGWFALTLGLIVALALTGCRDPGILYRYARPPPQVCTDGIDHSVFPTCCAYLQRCTPPTHFVAANRQDENRWRWNDQAQTYRPRNAYFDTDTAVVVEEFGTPAIG